MTWSGLEKRRVKDCSSIIQGLEGRLGDELKITGAREPIKTYL